MSLLLLALLVVFTAVTALVLADSGLRLWSALGGIAARKAAMEWNDGVWSRSAPQPVRAARVTMRVSYARPALRMAAPRRAAA